jgi:hypothetical protein
LVVAVVFIVLWTLELRTGGGVRQIISLKGRKRILISHERQK